MRRRIQHLDSKRRHAVQLSFETLEPRAMLDAAGFLTGVDVHLTLSFAADGTQIAGQSNALAAKFDSIAPEAEWKEVILRAFQDWAVNTNADIGVVTDGGQSFGSGGASQGDSRFGDIRIGAIAMAPNTGGVSVPTDGRVSGTWFADVIFNTAFDYQSLDDIYAIALHEAGNVFGLDDNNDPNSPLHTSIPPEVHFPTANDIANLQALHGIRAPDLNEVPDSGGGGNQTDNDSFANATQLDTNETASLINGSAPSIVYGDITSQTDLDFFVIDTPGNYTGPTTFQLRSQGISLLAPHLTIYDNNHQLLGEAMATQRTGDLVSVHLPTLGSTDKIFIKVSSDNTDVYGVGGYSLVVTFDSRNEIDQATIDAIAGGAFRFLNSEDLSKFFDADDQELFNDDMHTNDSSSEATELETSPGYVQHTRYDVVGSIADPFDSDFYTIKAPVVADPLLNVMTILIRSIDAGGLIPAISLLDEDDLAVPFEVLSNGGGDLIVQVADVTPRNDYRIEVKAATPGALFDKGNYELTVFFGSQTTVLNTLASAAIGNGVAQRTHTLYVGKPQLFHFLLQADLAATTSPTALLATIVDDQGTPVYQFATRPGETHSREAVLLEPGSYTVAVSVYTLDGSTPPEINYKVKGLAISDPFVGDPNDPTANPFACPEMPGFFCYPGDVISPDPFLWDDFISTLSGDPPPLGSGPLTTLLFGDWWTWVWNEFGSNGPAFAQDDTYHTPTEGTLSASGTFQSNQLSALTVGSVQGILGNDIDPEGGQFIALLVSDVSHGTLQLDVDGGFTYTPNPGYVGMDTFTYKTFDFIDESAPGTARIVVGISADFDADGAVSGRDFLTWQRGFGKAPDAQLTDGDADFDGGVGFSDLAVWKAQYPDSLTPTPSNGDADGDGDVDGRDFLAWQRGYGIANGAQAADGDSNADGTVDAEDLSLWQTNYGGTSGAELSSALTVENTPSVALVSKNQLATLTVQSGQIPVTPLLSTDQLQTLFPLRSAKTLQKPLEQWHTSQPALLTYIPHPNSLDRIFSEYASQRNFSTRSPGKHAHNSYNMAEVSSLDLVDHVFSLWMQDQRKELFP
ncbi:Ig-like domain-containing protein [Bythopirellula polymerisocia]|uniref:Matrixin n=1 Tax=Bythopirellula polymerisocia TaxID=2528003 RepID=A0A5C6CPL4_9BACT|nr:Ig-like domain-containing protein [Bythopirellula polymerisocia]TWU24689.1 hypothetical protein Pla144_35750 [Bythopirellula polymerisocia]